MTTILARLYKRYTTSANGGRRPTETTQQKIEPQVFNPTQVVDPVQLVDPVPLVNPTQLVDPMQVVDLMLVVDRVQVVNPIHRVLLPLATDVNTEHRAAFN